MAPPAPPPANSLAHSLMNDPEVSRALEDYKELNKKYEVLAKESFSNLLSFVDRIRDHDKALASIDPVRQNQIGSDFSRLRTLVESVEKLLENINSPIRRYDISEIAFRMLSTLFDLAPFIPTVQSEVQRERNRHAGKGRAKSIKAKADEGWRKDALVFFLERRDREPYTSQANLANEFIDMRTREDLECPGHEWVVKFIRSCEKRGMLPRSDKRPKSRQ
jgi:hypothetical protein